MTTPQAQPANSDDVLIPTWVDGVLTPVDKLEAHQRGLRHMAISVFVMQGDRLLIQQRAAGKYHTPGLWANTCCTHPMWQEDPADCAVRRLEEELGITGVPLRQREAIEYRAEVGNGLIEHEVADIFIGEAPANLTFTPNPEEVQATRWVTMADLMDELARTPEVFTPWIRIYMRDHHEMIFAGRS